MRPITEREYNRKLEAIRKKNVELERISKLQEEKSKFRKKKKISTSKLILLGMALGCIQILLYCEYTMYVTGDLSSMYALIGIPASFAATATAYYWKSKAENCKDGITYMTAMAELGIDDSEGVPDASAVG